MSNKFVKEYSQVKNWDEFGEYCIDTPIDNMHILVSTILTTRQPTPRDYLKTLRQKEDSQF